MTFLKKIIKIPLDMLASILRRNESALYYLVNEALKSDIQSVSKRAFAYQHIENAISIAKHLKITEGVILDVGGGTATTAMLFSKFFPNHNIYIFEPLQSNFLEIKKASLEFKNWILINKAVGSKKGTTQINVATRETASSLLEMNPKTEAYGDILVERSKKIISITTLDDEIQQDLAVIILKMDVQGYELEVLKGGIETLKRTSIVVLEVNNHDGYLGSPTYFELDTFLRDNHFVLYDILAVNRVNHKLQDWDAIYVKKPSLNN